jgi:hypothetical protein
MRASARILRALVTLAVTGLACARAEPVFVTPDLEPLVRELFREIAAVSTYRADAPVPPIFEMPQREVELAACDSPCNVVAAYFPGKAIYLASNLDPVRNPEDRAALLHELVHHLQYLDRRFAELPPCERLRAEEQEAFAIQNAYLMRVRSEQRVVFHDDADCETDADSRAGPSR